MHILLVEDHADTALVVERLLRRDGHTVAVAATIGRALELCDSQSFDLLICDLQLPDGSAEQLKEEMSACRNVRGIVVSGRGMEGDIRRSLQAGFEAHLVKPIAFDQLRSAIDRASRN